MKIINCTILIFLCGLLQACYPIYKTYQVPVKVTVLDEQRNAIQDAKVVMHTTQFATITNDYTVLKTDINGHAKFKRQRKMVVDIPFVIHGVAIYRWSLCISKNGYEKQDPILIERNKINRHEVVILKKDQSQQAGQECIDHREM